jgi:ArsR family metal-binding transcriptional regulator
MKKKMLWAAPYKPDKNAMKWAAEKNIELIHHESIADILNIKDIDERAEKLRELADVLNAGVIVGHNEVDLMKVIRRKKMQEVEA